MRRLLAALLLLVAALAGRAAAHELRPAFLDMKEISTDRFAIVWKVPAAGPRWLSLALKLPEACVDTKSPEASPEDNYLIERRQVDCPGGLRGRELGVDGLRASLTDVLVRIEFRDGASEVTRLTPERPELAIAGAMGRWETAHTYFALGVEHILTGIDHLMFVLALMLLIRDRWMLVKTVTAFTAAHSITLSGAALGLFGLPQRPVEAVIALSIAFVASELVKLRPGEPRLSQSHPWVVAFVFGLLHGFGFAGALEEIGLPHADVPLALLTFNAGVEAGQLLFVAAVLLVHATLTRLIAVPHAPARLACAYAIGTTAAVWLIDRLGGLAI